eukprot:gene24187-9781_t
MLVDSGTGQYIDYTVTNSAFPGPVATKRISATDNGSLYRTCSSWSFAMDTIDPCRPSTITLTVDFFVRSVVATDATTCDVLDPLSDGTQVTVTQALVSAASELGSPPALSGWVLGLNPCSPVWVGITCSAGKVVRVDLTGLGPSVASGLVPPALGYMESLTSITMESTTLLTGPLPPFWSRLTNLEALDVGSTSASGPLPLEWSTMTALTSLRLDNNPSLSGSLPEQWSTLANLVTLDASDNSLSGVLPTAWDSMVSLVTINLNNNMITSTIPSSWGAGFSSMVTINVSHNVLMCGITCVAGDVVGIDLVSILPSGSPGSIPTAFSSITTLTSIELGGPADLVGSLPSEWSLLTNLVVVEVSNTDASGTLPPSWSTLVALTSLTMNTNPLTGSLPPEWSTMTELVTLEVIGNTLTGSLPVEWCSLNSLTSLELGGNLLTANIPQQWSSCLTALLTLNVTDNSNTCGSVPSGFTATASTTKSEMGNSSALSSWLPNQDPCLNNWYGVTCVGGKVTAISLAGVSSGVIGSVPSALGSLTSLLSIELGGTSTLAGTLPPSWSSLTALSSLSLSNSSVAGSLPGSWSALNSLKAIAMDNNTLLTGMLPSKWSTLTGLTSLSLSGNYLTGTLPPSWSSMNALTKLDLSHNLFTATVPASWDPSVGMTRMGSLDLSDNSIMCGTVSSNMVAVLDYHNTNIMKTCAGLDAAKTLLEVKDQLGNPPNLSSWVSGGDPCAGSWLGVLCRDGVVVSLDLGGIESGRYITRYSQNLDAVDLPGDVVSLDLAGMEPEPDAVDLPGDVVSLTWLEWNQNLDAVDLPGDVVSLDPAGMEPATGFSAVLPSAVSGLSELTSLVVGGPATKGPFPPEWSYLDKLESLTIINSAGTGPLPPSWSGLLSLTSLTLDGNTELTGPLPSEWSGLSTLSSLTLSDNPKVDGTFPTSWSSLTTLTCLTVVGESKMTGSVPVSWSALTGLQCLTLSDQEELEGSLPIQWTTLTALTSLTMLNNAQVTGTLPSSWKEMSSLKSLSVGGSDLKGTLPSQWSAITSLRALLVSNAGELEGTLPSQWSVLTSVSSLVLESNGAIGGMLLSQWSTLVALSSMQISNSSKLQGPLPVAWSAPTSLVSVTLTNNLNMGGPLQSAWSSLVKLQSLDLSGGNLSGVLPTPWSTFTSLTNLDLASNSLSSTLPPSWSVLKSLKALDLSSNSLSSTLASSWSALKSLKALDLSSNSFTSHLPARWSSLSSLTSMDLSSNALSSTIPPSWDTMIDLSLGALDVSGNTELCGASTPARLLGITNTTDTGIGTECKNNIAIFLLLAKDEMDNPNSLSSWLPDSDPCLDGWSRVTCNDDGEVIGLDLRDVMSGSDPGSVALLPPSLGLLTKLESLLIGGSYAMVGTLPKQWSMLTNLVTLTVVDTGATGSLPAEWRTMTALTSLNLGGDTVLRGTLPAAWSQLTALIELNLSGADFSGELPAAWEALTALMALDLSDNKLSATLPSGWTNLASLTSLIVSSNANLCGAVPASISASVSYDGTGLGSPCLAAAPHEPPPPRPPVIVRETLFIATVFRHLLDLSNLPYIEGVEYIIDFNKLTTRFNVTAASPVQDCSVPSQITQKILLAEATVFPQPNISQACAPITSSRRLLSQAGEEGAPLQEGTRSLLQAVQDVPPACQPKATYDLVFLLDRADVPLPANPRPLMTLFLSWTMLYVPPACQPKATYDLVFLLDHAPYDLVFSLTMLYVPLPANTPMPTIVTLFFSWTMPDVPPACQPKATYDLVFVLDRAANRPTTGPQHAPVHTEHKPQGQRGNRCVSCFVPPPRPTALNALPKRPAFPPLPPPGNESDEIPVAIIGGVKKKKDKRSEDDKKEGASSEDSNGSFQAASQMDGGGTAAATAAATIVPWWGAFCCQTKEYDPVTGKHYLRSSSSSPADSLGTSPITTAPPNCAATQRANSGAGGAALVYPDRISDDDEHPKLSDSPPSSLQPDHDADRDVNQPQIADHEPDHDADQPQLFTECVPVNSSLSASLSQASCLSETSTSQERQKSQSTNQLTISTRDIAMKVAESHKNEMVKQKDGVDVGSPRLGLSSLVVDRDVQVLQQGTMGQRQSSIALYASARSGAKRTESIHNSVSFAPTDVNSPRGGGPASAWMDPLQGSGFSSKAARGFPRPEPAMRASHAGSLDTAASLERLSCDSAGGDDQAMPSMSGIAVGGMLGAAALPMREATEFQEERSQSMSNKDQHMTEDRRGGSMPILPAKPKARLRKTTLSSVSTTVSVHEMVNRVVTAHDEISKTGPRSASQLTMDQSSVVSARVADQANPSVQPPSQSWMRPRSLNQTDGVDYASQATPSVAEVIEVSPKTSPSGSSASMLVRQKP